MGHIRMLSDDSVGYHAKSIAEPESRSTDFAYFSGRGETPLVWGGEGAPALGLSGRATEGDYARVFAAGAGVGVATTRRGVEMVFRAGKSVSILGLVLDGHEADMHAIMDAEVKANLDYLESVVRTVGGRRGRAQTRVATGGMVYASTRHAYSRAMDPDLHEHVLIANVTEMADGLGGWKALDSALLYKHAQAADMHGRVAGAWEARRRGYAIEGVYDRRQCEVVARGEDPGLPSEWRIKGITAEMEDQFSKRSKEIDDAGKARGWDDGYRARSALARTTRAAKRYADIGDLKAGWQAEMVDRPLVVESGIKGASMTYRQPELEPAEVRAAGLLSKDGKLTDRKVFTRRDVVVAAGPALFGLEPALLDRSVAAVLADHEAVPLLPKPGASERGWSTATTLAIEGAIAKATVRAMTEVAEPGPGVDETAIDPRLTPGQRAALIGVTTSVPRMALICGVAGAGKTTVLSAVREAYEADGWQVLGTATSGQAARNLGAEAGMPAGTIRSTLWRIDHGRLALDSRTLLVLDEAGMVDDGDWLRLLRVAEESSVRIVAVGDHRQLGAVGPGGSFEALQQRHPDAVFNLIDNVRQKDVEERVALEHLRSGRVVAALDWYADHERLRVAPTGAEVMDLAVDAWWADTCAGKDTALLAYTRRTVAEANRLARERMVEAGRINVTREVQVSTSADTPRRYAPGDRIVVLAGDSRQHVVTSERGWVVDVGWWTQLPDIGPDNGRDPLGRKPGLPLPAIVVTLDSGATHTVTDLSLIDHGYAVTTHRAQGMTCDTCHYLGEGSRELSYVALSRGRDRNTVYLPADSLEQAVEDLGVLWRREDRELWVHDTDRQLRGEEQIAEARMFAWPKVKPVEMSEPEVEQEWEMGL